MISYCIYYQNINQIGTNNYLHTRFIPPLVNYNDVNHPPATPLKLS